MEGNQQKTERRVEEGTSDSTNPLLPKENSTVETIQTPEVTLEEQKKILEIKDRLLDNGAMIIEPLKGDPFILSRDHISTGEGVTTYTPDGQIKKISLAEHRAELAKGRAAARFFERSRNKANPAKLPARITKRVGGWFRSIFALFSKS